MPLLPLLAPLLASALLPLAAQVGPFTAPGTTGTPLPEPVARRAQGKTVTVPAPRAAGRRDWPRRVAG